MVHPPFEDIHYSMVSGSDITRLDEPERLAALNDSDLLDSPEEKIFDRAVKLATSVLGTPVGLLSLVDDRRQFFKAQVGLPDPVADDRETPLSHSFCQHVVRTDAPLVIPDARQDPLVRENPAIAELGVVAYLGVPVRDDRGHVLGSFCAIDHEVRDWTDREREILENIVVGVESEIALRAELSRRRDAETAVREAEERLRLALQAGRVGSFDLDLPSGAVRWDKATYDLWWIAQDDPDPMAAARARVHPGDLAVTLARRKAAFDPAGDGTYSLEFRILHPDTKELRWLHLDGQVRFGDGVPVRAVGTVRSITERRQAEERNKLLTQELNHRVKNLFAIVMGMIRLTARSATTPAEMAAALAGRVQALSIAHQLAQPAVTGDTPPDAETTLGTLLDAVLAPHARLGDGYERSGPETPIAPRAASNLALVFHELVTNAAKYGALSEAGGKLNIDWSHEHQTIGGDTPVLRLVWQESGCPGGGAPESEDGFGSTLIRMTVDSQLFGSWSRDWSDDGLSCHFELPLDALNR